MKPALLIFLGIFAFSRVSAQIEITGQLHSGLMHYSGDATTAATTIYSNGTQFYAANPYGSQSGFNYGGSLQAKLISKSGFIIGLQGGYSVLRSKEAVSYAYPLVYIAVYGVNNYVYTAPTAIGNAYLQNQNIELSPYIGYRLKAGIVSIDLMPGADFGFNLSSYEKGKATVADGTTYTVDHKIQNAPADVRLKFGAAAFYKKVGITLSYAHGLTNLYRSSDYSGSYTVHTELVEFGLAYKLL